MDGPSSSAQCSMTACKEWDLPVMCEACEKSFCSDHISYMNHQCRAAALEHLTVPQCKMCYKLLPLKAAPAIAIDYHLQNNCEAATIRSPDARRKCTKKGCKVAELTTIFCKHCYLNFCLRHRHPDVHKCKKYTSTATPMKKP